MPSHSSRHTGVELRHLRLLLAIAEKGSLTSVARHLGLTQPALSRQLRDLELRLRAPLFERTARRMVLTPAGEQLTHVARQVIAEVDTVERQIRSILDLFGDVELSLQVLYGNMPYEQAERSLRLFADEVMPRFQRVALAGQVAAPTV